MMKIVTFSWHSQNKKIKHLNKPHLITPEATVGAGEAPLLHFASSSSMALLVSFKICL